jgi:hypothetical protein
MLIKEMKYFLLTDLSKTDEWKRLHCSQFHYVYNCCDLPEKGNTNIRILNRVYTLQFYLET